MLDNAIVVEVDQYKWRLSFILLLNIYMRWFFIVESLLVCPCLIVMSSCWCC